MILILMLIVGSIGKLSSTKAKKARIATKTTE